MTKLININNLIYTYAKKYDAQVSVNDADKFVKPLINNIDKLLKDIQNDKEKSYVVKMSKLATQLKNPKLMFNGDLDLSIANNAYKIMKLSGKLDMLLEK